MGLFPKVSFNFFINCRYVFINLCVGFLYVMGKCYLTSLILHCFLYSVRFVKNCKSLMRVMEERYTDSGKLFACMNVTY